MSGTRLRLAIIGCGGIAAFGHVPALSIRDDIDIAYLCDLDEHRARVMRDRFSLDKSHCIADYRRILDDPSVEAVIVSSWPSNHLDIAIDAIESGRHVLIQKPLAFVAGSERLIEAATNSTRNILALPLIDAIPSFVALRSLLQEGELGTVSFARIRTTVPGPDDYYADVRAFFEEATQTPPPYREAAYAASLGSIADMGPYALSAFHYLFGPGTIRFAAGTPPSFDRCAIVILDITGRADPGRGTPLCSIETGWEQVTGREVCTVFGSTATACIGSSGELRLLQRDGSERIIEPVQRQRIPLPIPPLEAQARWIEAILAGEQSAFRPTVQSAIWVSRTIAEVFEMWHTQGSRRP